MTGPHADDCARQPHLHVGICQRAGYANGLKDAATAIPAQAEAVVVPNRDGDTDVRPWRPNDGDRRCQSCGHPNIVWFTDHLTWNRVMPDDGILCIPCFIRKAEAVYGTQAWGLFRDAPPFVGDFKRGIEAGLSMRPAGPAPAEQTQEPPC